MYKFLIFDDFYFWGYRGDPFWGQKGHLRGHLIFFAENRFASSFKYNSRYKSTFGFA